MKELYFFVLLILSPETLAFALLPNPKAVEVRLHEDPVLELIPFAKTPFRFALTSRKETRTDTLFEYP